MQSATDSLNWLARSTGQNPVELTAELGSTLQRPGSVRYLPYLSGERTPHNDAEIRGSFEALVATDAKLNQLIAIGGGSASRYWIELTATALGVPLSSPKSGEFGAALGVARLGITTATGVTPDSIMTTPEVRETIAPNTDLLSAFEDAYGNFRAAYPAIKATH